MAKRRFAAGSLPSAARREATQAGETQPSFGLLRKAGRESGGLEEKKAKLYKLWPAAAERRAARFFPRRPPHYPSLQLPQALMRASADGLRHLAPTWGGRLICTPENPGRGPGYRVGVAVVAGDPEPAGDLQTRQKHF